MIDLKSLGDMTVATFFTRVGDINNYRHSQELDNLADLSLREHSSGKYKIQKIDKRGRCHFRKAIYLTVTSLLCNNPIFHALHGCYTARSKLSFKKRNSH